MVRLWSFTEDPLAVARYGPLESEDGARRFEIEDLRPGKTHSSARLSWVRDKMQPRLCVISTSTSARTAAETEMGKVSITPT